MMTLYKSLVYNISEESPKEKIKINLVFLSVTVLIIRFGARGVEEARGVRANPDNGSRPKSQLAPGPNPGIFHSSICICICICICAQLSIQAPNGVPGLDRIVIPQL